MRCQVWSTAQSLDIKMRGYVEVRSTLPAKVNGGNLKVGDLLHSPDWLFWCWCVRAPGPPSGCWERAMVTSGRNTVRSTSSKPSMETQGWENLARDWPLITILLTRSSWQFTRLIITEAMASTPLTLTTSMPTSLRILLLLASSGMWGLM